MATRHIFTLTTSVALLATLAAVTREQDGAEHAVVASTSRHPKWPKVRDEWIKAHPECAACGQKDHVQAHHIIPVSFDASGDVDNDGIPNELDPDNLITLCTDGPGNCNCHLLVGHCGNYKGRNPNCRRDAACIRKMLDSIVFK